MSNKDSMSEASDIIREQVHRVDRSQFHHAPRFKQVHAVWIPLIAVLILMDVVVWIELGNWLGMIYHGVVGVVTGFWWGVYSTIEAPLKATEKSLDSLVSQFTMMGIRHPHNIRFGIVTSIVIMIAISVLVWWAMIPWLLWERMTQNPVANSIAKQLQAERKAKKAA